MPSLLTLSLRLSPPLLWRKLILVACNHNFFLLVTTQSSWHPLTCKSKALADVTPNHLSIWHSRHSWTRFRATQLLLLGASIHPLQRNIVSGLEILIVTASHSAANKLHVLSKTQWRNSEIPKRDILLTPTAPWDPVHAHTPAVPPQDSRRPSSNPQNTTSVCHSTCTVPDLIVTPKRPVFNISNGLQKSFSTGSSNPLYFCFSGCCSSSPSGLPQYEDKRRHQNPLLDYCIFYRKHELQLEPSKTHQPLFLQIQNE